MGCWRMSRFRRNGWLLNDQANDYENHLNILTRHSYRHNKKFCSTHTGVTKENERQSRDNIQQGVKNIIHAQERQE
jgi:hypothetical protein